MIHVFTYYSYSLALLVRHVSAVRRWIDDATITLIEDDPLGNEERPLTPDEITAMGVGVVPSAIPKDGLQGAVRCLVLAQLALADARQSRADYALLLHLDCWPVSVVDPLHLLNGHCMAGTGRLLGPERHRFLGPWTLIDLRATQGIDLSATENVQVWGVTPHAGFFTCEPCWHHLSGCSRRGNGG